MTAKSAVRMMATMNEKTNEKKQTRIPARDPALPPYAPVYDEAALDRFAARGREAWRDVPDAVAWVRELRGGDDEAQVASRQLSS